MTKYLLALLLAFFRLRVEGDPVNPDPVDPPADSNPDADLEGADPDPDADPNADPDPEPNAELETARREAKESKDRAERFEREAADLRARHQPRQDDEESRENAKLNDPAVPELEKWQIRANRELRAGRTAAQAALVQAADVRDQTAFAAVAIADPLAKRYQTRVEEELVKMRQHGQNAAREAIYTYLLGKDMREGKFKKKAAPAADKEKQQVPRGKLPGARSDVRPGAGGATEHEKRTKRLENVQI